MSSIQLHVDGEDGNTHSQVSTLGSGINKTDLALVRVGGSRDGRHGIHAPNATAGSPAGFLAVDLSQSTTVSEGIHAQILRFASRIEPPGWVEVPARRNLLITAIGGRGENGAVGGDGQPGMNGFDGTSATQEVDATDGGDGGNGGDAGLGTSGADGGTGGKIEISVNEDDTHLLFAIQCDVSGGPGGEAGCHGKPGHEGHGGKGGEGHRWKQFVGYKYRCTDSCVGNAAPDAMKRVGSTMGARSMALVAPLRAQAVQGSNLQAVVASVATQYGARRHQRINNDACRCKGGSDSCPGCEPVPIHSDFHRKPGGNGHDGRPGAIQTTPLVSGCSGEDGTVSIHVRNHDGSTARYESCYQLELVDFDVEDENGDGIFEPGEHIIVRRIRIRNSGGMPSPKCPIPISSLTSKGLRRVSGQDGIAFIQDPIAPGATATLQTCLKVLIPTTRSTPATDKEFITQDKLELVAVMPWLNRKMPHFNFSRTIEIQHPVHLRNFRYLPTLAQGSTSRFSYEVYNKSASSIGSPEREIEVDVLFPSDLGRLESTDGTWETETAIHVPTVGATESVNLEQVVQVAATLPQNRRATIQVALYFSESGQRGTRDEDGRNAEAMRLIQQVSLSIQLTSNWVFNEGSNFLLVINSKSSRDRVQAIHDFINRGLGMQFDEWNISLYGGLELRPRDDEQDTNYVLDLYKGKTVLFLGNDFEYFGTGSSNMCNLCDPSILATASLYSTRCVFLDCSELQRFRSLTSAWVSPIQENVSAIHQKKQSSTAFDSLPAFTNSIVQKRSTESGGLASVTYSLDVKPPRYLVPPPKPLKYARKVSKRLQRLLPQERFLVAPIEVEGHGPGSGAYKIAILQGPSQSNNISATEKSRTGAQISKFDAYMLIDSLSPARSLALVVSNSTSQMPLSGEQTSGALETTWVSEAAYLSILYHQNTEIRNIIHHASRYSTSVIDHWSNPTSQTIVDFLRAHLPSLSCVILDSTSLFPAQDMAHQPAIHGLLSYALASCRPQNTRQRVQSVALPIRDRRAMLYKCLALAIKRFVFPPFTANPTSLVQPPTSDDTLFRLFISNTKSFPPSAWLALHELSLDPQQQQQRLQAANNGPYRRDTHKLIVERIARFTERSEHEFLKGQLSGSDVVPETQCVDAAEWDRRWAEGKRTSERIRAETRRAWEIIGDMTVDQEEEEEEEEEVVNGEGGVEMEADAAAPGPRELDDETTMMDDETTILSDEVTAVEA